MSGWMESKRWHIVQTFSTLILEELSSGWPW